MAKKIETKAETAARDAAQKEMENAVLRKEWQARSKSKKLLKPVHLHWLWHAGPKAMQGIVLGMGACGTGKLVPSQFTHSQEQATCKACHAAAAAYMAQQAAQPAPPVSPKPAPARVAKANGQKATSASPKPNAGATIKVLVPRNPRRPGTGKHERMALLLKHSGKTVQEFEAAGGNLLTLKNAIIEKLVELV